MIKARHVWTGSFFISMTVGYSGAPWQRASRHWPPLPGFWLMLHRGVSSTGWPVAVLLYRRWTVQTPGGGTRRTVLLFEVGAEQSEGSSGAGGGRGALLPRFHRSLRSSLVVVQGGRRHVGLVPVFCSSTQQQTLHKREKTLVALDRAAANFSRISPNFSFSHAAAEVWAGQAGVTWQGLCITRLIDPRQTEETARWCLPELRVYTAQIYVWNPPSLCVATVTTLLRFLSRKKKKDRTFYVFYVLL